MASAVGEVAVAVAGAGYGEVGGDSDDLWVGPVDRCGLEPDDDRE